MSKDRRRHKLNKRGKRNVKSMIIGIGILALSLTIGFFLMSGDKDPNIEPENPPSVGGQNASEGESVTAAAVYAELEIARNKGFLLLINKSNPTTADYAPSDLESIKYYAEDRTAGSRYMRKEAAEQFHAMVEAAQEEGYNIIMTTAYRDYNFQTILFDNYVAQNGEEAANMYSAKPGESEHQTGLSVDVTSETVNFQLTTDFGATPEGQWLAENCKDFGFILRFPDGMEDITGYLYEPWHFRYTGKAAAEIIYEQDTTLEEFLVKFNDKTVL